METRALSDETLARNPGVDRDLVKDLADAMEALKRLGLETQGRFSLCHPFDSQLVRRESPSAGRQGSANLASSW